MPKRFERDGRQRKPSRPRPEREFHLSRYARVAIIGIIFIAFLTILAAALGPSIACWYTGTCPP